MKAIIKWVFKTLLTNSMQEKLIKICKRIRTFWYYFRRLKKIRNVSKQLADDMSRKTLWAYVRLRMYGLEKNLVKLSKPSKLQYFDDTVFTFDKNEVFVDMGAFDGETALNFVEKVDGMYQAIYMFEPDYDNYIKSKERVKHLSNTTIYNEACCDVDEMVSFVNALHGSHISTTQMNSEDGAAGVRLDSKSLLYKPTYIKMDVEGFEINALNGAMNIIKEHRPKLAVCIYHKRDDIFILPMLMKSLLPDAKLYIRHYHLSEQQIQELPFKYNIAWELVCYAIPNATA